MKDLIKIPYEISVWEDRLTAVDNEGNEYDRFPDANKSYTQYYKEVKICTIGSSTMESPYRIVEPNLVRKTDGTSTLTFSMYNKVYDEESGEFIENPYGKYLTNERKIKLKYYPNGELRWLDFVIKKIEESSENYKFKYTATDLFINELSKTGYNLVFDTELKNGQGTIRDLAERVLEGSDWSVGEDSEIIRQLKEEPLYEIELGEDLEAYDVFSEASITIPSGKTIYAFYSSVNGGETDYYQFIYDANGNYPVDEKGIVRADRVGNYYCNAKPSGNPTLFTKMRGERYVRTQSVEYDAVLEKYVNVYKDSADSTVYGYTESEYFSPSLVTNLITNGHSITDGVGWKQQNGTTVMAGMRPQVTVDLEPGKTREFGLEFNYNADKNTYLINSGFKNNAETIKEIVEGQPFAARIKLTEELQDGEEISIRVIGEHKPDASNLIIYGTFSKNKQDSDEFYYTTNMSAQQAISYEELIDINSNFQIYLFLEGTKHIQQVELFAQHDAESIADSNGNTVSGIVLPDGRVMNLTSGTISTTIAASQTKTKYYYYKPDNEIKKPEQMTYLYIGYSEQQYTPVYSAGFEKVRNINQKESNRFNLLQTLSETFGCWCRFDIWHKENGEIMLNKDIETLINAGNASSSEKVIFLGGSSQSLDDYEYIIDAMSQKKADVDNPYQQLKFVTFHKSIGQKKHVGFRYGLNLKSISRTLDSNNIATKLIVKSNSNQFAKGGSCNIALARENPSGENFVYNFNHYIKRNLMNEENLTNDLYYDEDETNENKRGWIGLYVKLKRLNTKRDKLATQRVSCTSRYAHSSGNFENARIKYKAGMDELDELKQEYCDLAGFTYEDRVKDENKDDWKNDQKIVAIATDIERLNVETEQWNADYEKAEAEMRTIETEISNLDELLKDIETRTANLINTFEKKYIRFIQEASWISEDYTDHNLYYLDAESTLHKSAQPKVSYTINVIDLSQQKEYENYIFDLGDITYIQDTDYFGWEVIEVKTEKETAQVEQIKTPRREEIVITELSTFFDQPEKSTIKVQNYRTSFEDLFQRLTASAQQLQFHSGAYERAADVVDANGNIAPSCLEDAFANNAYILSNAANQSVKWDEYGITTTNTVKPAEIVRITSGGIFLSEDGGEKWTTGITARGINAKTITTGVLDTGKINIYNGNQKSFAWDSQGLNAYAQGINGGYSPNKFVRFNQFGVFGVEDASNKDFSSVDSIKANASFYLGWDGLHFNKGTINWNNIALPENLKDIEQKVTEINSAAQELRNSQLSNRNYIKNPGNYTSNGSTEGIHYNDDGWECLMQDGFVRFKRIDQGAKRHVFFDCSENPFKDQPYTISAKIRWTMVEGQSFNREENEELALWFGIRANVNDRQSASSSVKLKMNEWVTVSTLIVPDGKYAYNAVYFGGSDFKLNEQVDIEWISITKGDQGNSAVTKLNTSVGQYLGLGGNTLISDSYVISPYIGGGYLNIASIGDDNTVINSVIINPKGLGADNTNKIFEVKKGNSTVMSITTDGNATFTGVITATGGDIGGWVIGNNGIKNEPKNANNELINGTYLNSNWPTNVFATVDRITAKNDWRLLLGRSTATKTEIDGIKYSTANFGVDKGGILYATGANIAGKITATEGDIGSWKIASTALQCRDSNNTLKMFISATQQSKPRTINGVETDRWGIWSNSNFGVTQDGQLCATGAKISGVLTAGNDSGIGAWTIKNNALTYDDTRTETAYAKYNNQIYSYTITTSNFQLTTAGVVYKVKIKRNSTATNAIDYSTETELLKAHGISELDTEKTVTVYWSRLGRVLKE